MIDVEMTHKSKDVNSRQIRDAQRMIEEEAKTLGDFDQYWVTFQNIYCESKTDEKDQQEETLEINNSFKEQLEKCHKIEDELL